MDYCEAPADDTSCQPGRYGERKSVETTGDGTWDADELQAGYHLVTVDLPTADWQYGPPPGSTEPRSQYFVEVEGQSSARAADATAQSSLTADEDSLDFHLVQRADDDPIYGVLVLFYNSTRGPTWEDQTNWLTDKPYGEWHGVEVDGEGNVVELVLPGNGLRDYPTPLLDSLVHLKRLDLTSNFFDGYPSTYGNFDSLTYLDLSNTFWKGDIPDWIANLTSLDTLLMDFNHLTGSIPAEFGDLTNLEYLDLNRNKLTGTIPTELGDLTNLKRLSLYENDLSGTIPTELGDLSNLEILDLSYNDLTGTIPTELGDLSNLTNLDLKGNQLTGAFPDALTALTNLVSLDVGENNLTSIPSNMSSMTSLRWVWINDNDLSGSIPIAPLLTIPKLSGLNAAGNGFTGTIPSFGTERLDWLDLSDNSLTGSIPFALGDMITLYDLSLNGNSLSGAIPPELGNLERIKSLWLHDNSLTGNIPTEFGDLTTLQGLYVNGNSGLTGTLPSTLTSLTRLYRFHAQDTDLCAPTDTAFQTWLSGVSLRDVTNCTP